MAGTGSPINITGRIVLMNHRNCKDEDWEATLEVEIFDLLKQLSKQGLLFDFKLHGVSYDPSINFEAI